MNYTCLYIYYVRHSVKTGIYGTKVPVSGKLSGFRPMPGVGSKTGREAWYEVGDDGSPPARGGTKEKGDDFLFGKRYK